MADHLTRERIAHGSSIWRLSERRPIPVNLYAIELNEGVLLLDTGNAGFGTEILDAVAAITRNGLRGIVITHGHRDHMGALADLVAATGAPVYAHPDEIPFLTGAKPYGDLTGWWGYVRDRRSPGKPVPAGAIRPLADGERIGPLIACHTPGHTPGHLAYYFPAESALFPGDVIMHTAGRITGPIWFTTYDIPLVRQSARRLLANGAFDALLPSHGKPIMKGAHALVAAHVK